jgi:hypothetical protein
VCLQTAARRTAATCKAASAAHVTSRQQCRCLPCSFLSASQNIAPRARQALVPLCCRRPRTSAARSCGRTGTRRHWPTWGTLSGRCAALTIVVLVLLVVPKCFECATGYHCCPGAPGCSTSNKLFLSRQGAVLSEPRLTAGGTPQLYVRRHYFYPPSRLSLYYEGVASQVRAETQVRPPLHRPAALHRALPHARLRASPPHTTAPASNCVCCQASVMEHSV